MRSTGTRSTQFGVCTDNIGYPASLEVGKLYPVIPDAEAAKHGYIRVIDESGQEYGYSVKRFFLLPVPEALAKALSARSDRQVGRPNRRVHRLGETRQPVVR
jgi:hypothetical protein